MSKLNQTNIDDSRLDSSTDRKYRKHKIKQHASADFRDELFPDVIWNLIPNIENICLKDVYIAKKLEPISVDDACSKDLSQDEMASLCFPQNSIWRTKDFDDQFRLFTYRNKFLYTINSNNHCQSNRFGRKRSTSNTVKIGCDINTIKNDCQFRIGTTNLWRHLLKMCRCNLDESPLQNSPSK